MDTVRAARALLDALPEIQAEAWDAGFMNGGLAAEYDGGGVSRNPHRDPESDGEAYKRLLAEYHELGDWLTANRREVRPWLPVEQEGPECSES